MYRKLDKNNTKNDRALTFLPYYKIVHHFHFLLATTSCKNVETLYRKTRLFLLNITPNHTSVKSNRPPPPPSPVLKELFHQNLKHVLATLRSGGGVTSTATTQRRPISLNEVQCLKSFCNWL